MLSKLFFLCRHLVDVAVNLDLDVKFEAAPTKLDQIAHLPHDES
jgi:hypothetical protein